MSWLKECQEWQACKPTRILKENVCRAILDLQDKLVYAEEERNIFQIQGMIRAYYDMLEVIANIQDEQEQGESNE